MTFFNIFNIVCNSVRSISTFSTFSTLFVTVFVQYNSFDSSVTHKRSFLLLHSTGAVLGGLLGGLAQPRAADFKSPAAVVVSGHARPNGHFIWQTGHCIEVTDLAKFLFGVLF